MCYKNCDFKIYKMIGIIMTCDRFKAFHSSMEKALVKKKCPKGLVNTNI